MPWGGLDHRRATPGRPPGVVFAVSSMLPSGRSRFCDQMLDRALGNGWPYPRNFGPYLLLSALSEPFVGSLHLAVIGDGEFERLVVQKILGPRLTEASDVARFREEASAVVRLSHRNLVPVFDAGLVGDEAFLAMEFVEGRNLHRQPGSTPGASASDSSMLHKIFGIRCHATPTSGRAAPLRRVKKLFGATRCR